MADDAGTRPENAPGRSAGTRQVIAVLIAVGLVGGGWWALRGPRGAPGSDAPSRPAGPRASWTRSRSSGIDFRMSFLPDEQGEHFKINLYDHGCGVAVGDFDGDGRRRHLLLQPARTERAVPQRGRRHLRGRDGEGGRGARRPGLRVARHVRRLRRRRATRTCTSPGRAAATCCSATTATGPSRTSPDEAGLTLVAHSQTAVFFDYDNDGYLDLFVTNTAKWTTDVYDGRRSYFAGAGGASSGLIREPARAQHPLPQQRRRARSRT